MALDPFAGAGAPRARSACVIAGVAPEAIAALHVSAELAIRGNRLGTLVTGRLAAWPLEYAERLGATVYDVLANPRTGWFCVTIYEGHLPPRRFEPGARGDTVGGYARAPDILGATTRDAVLAALDVPAEVLT
jgi:hypothetical protein